MVFGIVVGAVVVAVGGLGWWSSGRKSSALHLDDPGHASMKADMQARAQFRNDSTPGGGPF